MAAKKRISLPKLFGALILVATLAFLLYFPGRQTPIALSLASGIGVSGIQKKVDALEEKAIQQEAFTEQDIRFLRNLYASFVKGARLTIVLRQSAELMDHYLDQSGQDRTIDARIFLGSQPVQNEINAIEQTIRGDRQRNSLKPGYTSPTFYMGDPNFFESYVGLYFGTITATPTVDESGSLQLTWNAEMPWQWPSYDSLHQKYGDHHAQSFPIPNAASLFSKSHPPLYMDDGLGEHLAHLGLAKPFMVRGEWTGILD